jgi:hypothetical protein
LVSKIISEDVELRCIICDYSAAVESLSRSTDRRPKQVSWSDKDEGYICSMCSGAEEEVEIILDDEDIELVKGTPALPVR